MNTPINNMNPLEATKRLTQTVIEAYKRKSRQLPSNLPEIVDTFKADLLRYMPTIGIDTVDESVIFEVLHDDKTPFSPSFLFQAVRRHYSPPARRPEDARQKCRPDVEQDTVNLLDVLADGLRRWPQRLLTFNSWRMYRYLVMRGQLAEEAYMHFADKARMRLNAERVKDFKRPLAEFTGDDLTKADNLARHLAVADWIAACNTAGLKPSDILTPLMDEQSYRELRKTC